MAIFLKRRFLLPLIVLKFVFEIAETLIINRKILKFEFPTLPTLFYNIHQHMIFYLYFYPFNDILFRQ